MNNYERTEKWLRELASLKAKIKNLEIQYKELEADLGSNAIDYSKDKISQTYKFSSDTENKGITLGDITKEITVLENRIKMLENAMDALTATEKTIIEIKYFDNEPWFKIACKVGYSERHCRRVRSEAIKKLSIAIFCI